MMQCSVILPDGTRCDRPFYAKERCQAHYQRRYQLGVSDDTPIVSKRGNGYLRALVAVETDECIIALNRAGTGRAHVTYHKVHMKASRAAWLIVHGMEPSDLPSSVLVLHRCSAGSGDSGCVNPRHLYLGTSADNSRDMAIAGRAGKTVVTWEQVEEIRRRFKPGIRGRLRSNAAELAPEYGVTPDQIYRIATGRSRIHRCAAVAR